MIAARIARPLTPRMSLTTRVSFTFASSSVFCSRSVCRATSPTSCLRVRVRSRNSWIGAGSTKLPRISPCANRVSPSAVVRGRSANAALMEGARAMADQLEPVEHVLDFEETIVAGDYAFQWGTLSIELPVARIRGGVLGRRQADADPAAPNRRLVEDASHDDGRRPGGRVAGVVVVPPRDAGSLAHLAVKPGGLVVAADDRAPGAEAHGTGRYAGDRSPRPAGRGSQAASPRQSPTCRGTASPP